MSALPTPSPVTLLGLDAETYRPHALHAGARTYLETNCYADILIELLHARGHEPLAALGFLVRMDFEGDQWTFFKPPPGDVERLFGIDIHEMQPYRSLPLQVAEQLGAGRTMIVELDAWHLPDTAATSYRREHVKTSVAMEAIDPSAGYLRYFHNAGLYELSGEDFHAVFATAGLPPYAELVRFDAGTPLAGPELRETARELLRHHLARRPGTNPFERFGERLAEDLPALLEGDAEGYHAYAFATVRMAGSAFELAAAHVSWLLGEDAGEATSAFAEITEGCKLLSFKLARRRRFDTEPAVAPLADAWQRAMETLDARAG